LFLGGSGFLLYVILWIIVPDERQAGAAAQDGLQANSPDLGKSVGHAAG